MVSCNIVFSRYRDDAEPAALPGQEGHGHDVRPQRGAWLPSATDKRISCKVAQQELMQQLRIFLEIHELWRQIDPDGPMAKRVLEEYKALPRDMPREQLTEQGKCLGSQPAWHMRSVKGLRQGFTALLVEGSVHSIARALLEVTSSSFGFGTVMAHHFSTAARTESHLS